MILKADLHVHTTASDGRTDIAGLVREAKRRGLDAIAVCDHNMCTPLPDLQTDGIMLIPATEISTKAGHVLGLFVKDIDFKKLRENGLPEAADAVNLSMPAADLPYWRTRLSIKTQDRKILTVRTLIL